MDRQLQVMTNPTLNPRRRHGWQISREEVANGKARSLGKFPTKEDKPLGPVRGGIFRVGEV